MSIQIANYQGIGWVSRAIKLLTYSQYSHTAALFADDMEVVVNGKTHYIASGTVIEAWKGGVRVASSIAENHVPRTKVDIFALKSPLTGEQEQRVARCLIEHIGTKYSYWNVLRFVPIVRIFMLDPPPFAYTRTHVFCSELVLESFARAPVLLLERCKFFEVPPRDPPRSPLLRFVRQETC